MIINRINISQIFGNRLDVSFYKKRYNFTSKTYPSFRLSQLIEVNPSISLRGLSADTEISFIPMEVIDEKNGVVSEYRKTTVSKSKGFTKFENGDLIWAKITPCMQNGKSAIVSDMINGVGCGSTEFYVLRPKEDNILIEYVYYILRDRKVLDAAKDSFGGSAGQQRVSSSYIKSLMIPLPPIDVQQKIVAIYQKAQDVKQAKEAEAKALLASIDEYLLRELGIVVPSSHKREVSFKINISDLIGNRLNPYSYNAKTLALKNLIISNKLDKVTLSDVITSSIAGDWGIDENDDIDNDTFTKCLVIRATEFDNKYNLNLENSRVKYRNIKSAKLDKMQIDANDILIEKSGGSPDQPVGRVAFITDEIASENICYSNFIHKIKLDAAKINPKYAFYYLATMYRIGMTESIQSQTNGIRNLIMGSYLKQLIILPKNQNDIVAHIDDMYSKAKILEAQADTLVKDAKEQIEKIILG